MTDLMAAARAEILRLRRWPALWIMVGSWLVLNLAFGYVIPYVTYRSAVGDVTVPDAAVADRLADILPGGIPVTLVTGMPMFGGAILMILGAIAVGSGYGWGTWKTVFTQGASRVTSFGGTLLALAGVVVAVVIATLGLDLISANVVALVEGAATGLPAFSDTLQGFGAGLLISAMWLLAGVFLGIVARGPALAVGLGLVWTLVIENLLRGVTGVLGWLGPITDAFPGTAAGSMAGSVGAAPIGSGPEGTPGVLDTLSGGAAAVSLSAYVVAFALAAILLVRQRDLT